MPDETTSEKEQRRGRAVVGAAEAPVIFFEVASTYGVRNAVSRITLEINQPALVEGAVSERRVMAHLRFPVTAIVSLRRALDLMEEQLKPVAAELKN